HSDPYMTKRSVCFSTTIAAVAVYNLPELPQRSQRQHGHKSRLVTNSPLWAIKKLPRSRWHAQNSISYWLGKIGPQSKSIFGFRIFSLRVIWLTGPSSSLS